MLQQSKEQPNAALRLQHPETPFSKEKKKKKSIFSLWHLTQRTNFA